MSVPNTEINICSGIPFTNTYDHTVRFSSVGQQSVYLDQHVVKTLSNYTTIRRTWSMKVEALYSEAITWNYLFFTRWRGKPTETMEPVNYCYFITSVEYINDSTVELFLEMDVMQTYMCFWKLNPCFVEREHSAKDNIGENTLDEGLDVGENLITVDMEEIDLSSNFDLLIASTINLPAFSLYVDYENPDNTSKEIDVINVLGSNYGNVYSGFVIYAISLREYVKIATLLEALQSNGQIDTIFMMWLYPSELIEYNPETADSFIKRINGAKMLNTFIGANVDGWTHVGIPTGNDFTPRNNKLLQYPYRFMTASNGAGESMVYKYEQFQASSTNKEFSGASFYVKGNIAPDNAVMLTPVLYNEGTIHGLENSLMMNNFPVCSWNSDPYKLWLAQNQHTQNLGMINAGMKIAGGVVTGVAGAVTGNMLALGGGGGAVLSGIGDIQSLIAQRKDVDIQPPQVRGSNSGSFNASNKLYKFFFYHKQIDDVHARVIDDYFTMYGYACRRVKVPDLYTRPLWTYIKTIGSNITGAFCNEDIQKINSIFDKGITFWSPGADFGDYTQDNSPS